MLKDFSFSFVSLFVALDIVGILPMYISMIQHQSPEERKKTIRTSMIVAFIVALLFTLGGQALFKFMNITLFDFKIAGGIVLLLVSLADLLGSPESKNRASGSTGIVPLAVPLITGPAAMTTLVIQAGSYGYPITIASMIANYLIAWVILQNSFVLTRLFGRDGTVVISKIAALLLAAIGVAMIRSGVYGAITGH
jgi:multiple antibiotic resistance protein